MNRSNEQADGRYTFHPLVRRLARQHLEAEAEVYDDTRGDFLAHYAGLPDPRTGMIPADWFKQIESDYPNLLTALELALAQPETAQLALGLSSKLWLYWFRGGYWQEGVQWLTAALEQTAGVNELRAWAYLMAAVLAARLGQPEQARSLLQVGREMTERLNFKEGWAIIFQTLSFAAESYQEKAALLEQSLTAGRAAPGSFTLLYSLYLYGDAAREHGQLDQAEGLYREALVKATERGYLDIIIYALGNLGRLALLRGQEALAKLQLEKAAALARESGNRVTLADWLLPLGRAALYRREFQQAAVYLQECYDLWQEMGIAAGQAEVLTALAELALARGNLNAAARDLHASLTLWLDLWQRQSHQLTAMLRGLVDSWLAVGRLAGEIRPSPEAVAILASAEQVRSAIEYRLDSAIEVACQVALKTARETLSSTKFEATWAKGQSLSLDDSFNLAYGLLV